MIGVLVLPQYAVVAQLQVHSVSCDSCRCENINVVHAYSFTKRVIVAHMCINSTSKLASAR